MTLVLWQTLKGQRIALLLLSLGLFGFAILIPAMFDSLVGVGGYLESMPEGIKSLLKAQGRIASTPIGFLAATGYRHPIYFVTLVAFVIASASGAMAREIERGTVFMLLSRPLHRYRLVLAKLGAMLLGLILLLGAALLGTWTGALAFGLPDIDFPSLLLVQVNALFLTLAIAGYSFLISALSSEGGRTIALAAGLAVVFFFLDFLSSFWSAVHALGPVSLFHYYDPLSIVDNGSVSALHLGVLAAVAVVGFAGALVAFQRRDISR